MAVNWDYYDKFQGINNKYLSPRGEGNTMATQIVTAVGKLVYKWYNDGDVFDNTRYLCGWCNDLSSYANWLHEYTRTDILLERVWYIKTDEQYEDLLKELADYFLDEELLELYNTQEKRGSIYDCEGPFKYEDGKDYYGLEDLQQ